MTVEDFTSEFWTRVLVETMELDTDVKYVVRGVVQSVIHDMKETHKEQE